MASFDLSKDLRDSACGSFPKDFLVADKDRNLSLDYEGES